ncbi:MAG: phosphoenolpyruvate carboxykinase [Rickettsiales bacterium]|nr:MAG: phosphoenolpyruvate carboxykinase [Rickettsiales bacterium]
MLNEFSVNRKAVITNFSKKYCTTSAELLSSDGFKKILDLYVEKEQKNDTEIYNYIKTLDVIEVLKLLIVFDFKTLKISLNKDLFLEFVENFYNFWRNFERYAIILNENNGTAIQQTNFIGAMENFKDLVLQTYRSIEENLMQTNNNIYRQLNAGINVGVVISNNEWNTPNNYKGLSNINFIKNIILQPPFFVYTKENTRKGTFNEVAENPIKDLQFKQNEWLCYPVKIGSMLAFVYFNTDFMAQGISLSNLFEMAKDEEYKGKKPDLILIFGADDGATDMKYPFFIDKDNDIIVGYLNHNEKIDYFGYMKKMLLTIYNVKMIEKGNLPIHGAMVNITFKNGKRVNVALMGDSGAGKSESLEAFRELAGEYIKDMKTIFDDMGYFALKDDKVYGYGTETGAFVRLDDLDKGYAYKNIDRSIFLNPDRINARVIIPVATYEVVNNGYQVDYFLYANNYEDGEEISFFKDAAEAKEVFVKGARMAKGTTSEVGLTTSYFANPFGPVQKQEKCNVLIDKFFDSLFKNGVKVGQIRTRLGIDGMEHEGPLKASKKLFELIKN